MSFQTPSVKHKRRYLKNVLVNLFHEISGAIKLQKRHKGIQYYKSSSYHSCAILCPLNPYRSKFIRGLIDIKVDNPEFLFLEEVVL